MDLKLVEYDLVLLPGLDGTGTLFSPFTGILPNAFTASVISFPTQHALPYKQLIPYILQNMPWDRPFTLVAESFSGPLALEFAAAHPEKVQAIVLVSSFVSNPLPPWLQWAKSVGTSLWFRWTPSEAFLRKFFLGTDCAPVLVDALAQALKSVRPEVLAHRIRQVFEADARVALQNCRKPILYLLADQDKIVGKRGWQDVVALRPDITTVTLDGPHLLLQRKPREALAAIEKFLERLHRPAAGCLDAA